MPSEPTAPIESDPSPGRVAAAWRAFWRDHRWELLISLALTPLVIYSFGERLEWSEQRPDGVAFDDPAFRVLGPWNVTWLILPLSWTSMILWARRCLTRPLLLIDFGQLYAVVMGLKILTMTLLPLYAPPDIIELKDPYIEAIFYQGEPRLRDLMFSGHTAQPIALALLLAPGRLRWVLFGLAAAIGFLVVAQHVHYSIDVLAAPPCVWLGWRLQRWVIGHWRDPAVLH